MLWHTASLFTVLQYHDHGTSEMRVHIKTMAMCKQYSAGEVGRLSKHEIYWAFSGRIHFYEFPYNTYISWPLLNALKCSIASTERVVNGSCVYKPLLVEVHTGFFSIHWGKSSRRHFCFKLVNLYLLYEIRNRVWRDCKQSSINKSMFSSENFQKLRAVKDSPWLCAT